MSIVYASKVKFSYAQIWFVEIFVQDSTHNEGKIFYLDIFG